MLVARENFLILSAEVDNDCLHPVCDFDGNTRIKDLGELATERKRVEWLGQKLMLLQPGPFKIRQKKVVQGDFFRVQSS